jgi:hypothetical protein
MRITVGKDNYIQQVDIKLPEGKQRIGVMLSGGADSAVLLYLLCLERKMDHSTQELIPFTVARPDGAWDYVKPIVEWVRNKLSLTAEQLPDPIKVGDATVHHSQQGRTGEHEARTRYGIEHVFYGSQAHPDRALIELPGEYPNRPASVELPGTTCPFALVDKRHTLSLYDTFDIWPLIELTHSCTALTVGRCGECYNCKEREWALGQLGVADLGNK